MVIQWSPSTAISVRAFNVITCIALQTVLDVLDHKTRYTVHHPSTVYSELKRAVTTLCHLLLHVTHL